MRNPILDLAGNLQWTTSGTVYATWRLDPLPYGRRPVQDKKHIRDLHRAMVRALPGEAVLSGLSVSLDPGAVVERQIAGVDLDACPMWIAEAQANLDRLSDPAYALGRRVYYLTVPLANKGNKRWQAPSRVALEHLKEFAGLPRSHPSDAELALRMKQAESVAAAIPRPFNPRPVGVAEQIWMAAHHQSRGLQSIPPETAVEVGELVTTSGVALPEPILDPGALSDLDRRRVNPFGRQVLKVRNPTLPDEPASYQALMALASPPTNGVQFPGCEMLNSLDELGPECDFVIRLLVRGRDKVLRENRKAVRDLNDQYQQRDDGSGFGSEDLDLAAELLSEYAGLFASDRNEVEVQHTVLVAVGSDTFDTTDEHAKLVARFMDGADFQFVRPVGAEEDLWWAMHATVPTTRTVHAFRQYTTSTNFARLVPVTSTHIGNQRGPIVALNTSTVRTDVVHLDPAGYPEIDKSGSVAVCGELGSGKSYAMKTICAHIVGLDGQLLSIDSSVEQEWATFARALTPEASIIDPKDPEWSMDPLRCVPDPKEASAVTESFLATLLNTSPREREGITLAHALQVEYRREHGIEGLEDLLNHLGDPACALPHADELAEQLGNFARSVYGRVVFDQSVPPADPTCQAVVWLTAGMEQPTDDEISQAHLYRQLQFEKVFGRAYYRLIMGCMRRWSFLDRSRPTACACDESHKLFANPENRRDGEFIVREGRRAKACLVVGSHDPGHDFGSDTMRSLIPTRIVMRQTDKDLAEDSIRFLDLPEDDPEFAIMIKQLREDTSPAVVGQDGREWVPPERRGECFIKDAFGRVGDAKILGPAQEALRQAVESTPPKSRVTL